MNDLDASEQRLLRLLSHEVREELEPFQAMVSALMKVTREGGMCMPLTLKSLTENGFATRFLNAFRAGHYHPVIAKIESASTIDLTALPPTPLIVDQGCLYWHRHFHAEQSIAQGIRRIRSHAQLRFPIQDSKGLQIEGLDTTQAWALATALVEPFLIISGGPGTGKTFLAARILQAMVKLKGLEAKQILLAAPTGRASHHLTESIRLHLSRISSETFSPAEFETFQKLEAQTLHQLLGYHPGSGTFRFHADNPLDAQLIVVDEASMIDAWLFSALVQAVPDGSSLILLGDMDQLPSVKSGSILAALLPLNRKNNSIAVFLEKSHRSEPRILAAAQAINLQMGNHESYMPLLDGESLCAYPEKWPLAFQGPDGLEAPDAGCRLILRPLENSLGFRNRLIEAYADRLFQMNLWDPHRYPGRHLVSPRPRSYSELLGLARNLDPETCLESSESLLILKELFSFLELSRILTFSRRGFYGCESVNQHLARSLRGKWDAKRRATSSPLFHGVPFMILENTPDQGLSNGDVGLFLCLSGHDTAVFPFASTFFLRSTPLLPPLELAFATTVHKSQGSEFDQVLILLPEPNHRLLSKELLYTGVTRARHFAGICGPSESLSQALNRKMERESGLRNRLST